MNLLGTLRVLDRFIGISPSTGIGSYPEFNGFTHGFSLSSGAGDEFQEAVDAMWRAAASCSDGMVTQGTPSADPATSLGRLPDPACVNTAKAPHNWEGFFWTLGLMELKAGNTQRGMTALENAKRSSDYASWPFRAEFQTDLDDAPRLAKLLAAGDSAAEKRMLFGSARSCVACHQR